MKTKRTKTLICYLVLIALVFACLFAANRVQSDSGKVTISEGSFEVDSGKLVYKLYRPDTATSEAPAPAVLLLHGYQNDKDTCAAYAIELARRGYVVLALDEYGHGESSMGMIERGFVNHKVTVNYGEDSEKDGTYVEIGGQKRYRVMMNFSNLSFFNDHYSKDVEGNSIKDSSMGGAAAYALMSGFDFVDPTRMAVSGHSMGTWASWSVAAACSSMTNESGEDISPKAVVLQCGELFTKDTYDQSKIRFNNVLVLTAKYDEFSYFRAYENTVSDHLLERSIVKEFLNTSTPQFDTVYGSFDDGSAREIRLIYTNHRLMTHNDEGMSTALTWFDDALGVTPSIDVTDHVFMLKEVLQMLSMFAALFSMLPLLNLLLTLPFFKDCHQALPARDNKVKKGWAYWRGALITILIAALTYPFMTQLGHGLLPLPESVFRMTIGNGFLSWYLLLILIMLITTLIPWKKSRKKGSPIDFYDIGLSRQEHAYALDWLLLGKSLLLTALMVSTVYLWNALAELFFDLDFRFIWPFFRSFSLTRLGQFFVYLPVFAVFFILNNSKIFAQMRQSASSKPGFKGFMSCWWKHALLMAGGILLLVLLEYIPFFAGVGPGADLLFGSTFGGPFMSLMIVFIPQILVFSLICTFCYRRTGSVYVGGLCAAMLSCWIVTGGSAML